MTLSQRRQPGIFGSVTPEGMPRELSAAFTPRPTFSSSPFFFPRHLFIFSESDTALILKWGNDEGKSMER